MSTTKIEPDQRLSPTTFGILGAKGKSGWSKLQAHTQKIVSDKRLEKANAASNSKNMTSFINKSRLVSQDDRTYRINEEIDNIRRMQNKLLSMKEKTKNRQVLHIAHRSFFANLLFYFKTFTIHPKARWKQGWDAMILLFVIFSSVQIPLLLAFPDINPLSPTVQAALDILFIIDFGMCFRTGFVRPDNEIELSHREIVANYLKTWFWIDLAACFPLDYFFPESATDDSSSGNSADGKALLRLLKLPRLLRLGRLLKFLARFKYAGAMKIVKFILMLVLVAHWVGCFFFFLMGLESPDGKGTWMEQNIGPIQPGENIGGRYLNMLYTSFLMLIGEGMDMETDVERFYGAIVVLLGTIITAVIVGNVSFVVSNQNSMSFQYRAKIDTITDEMRALRLPAELMDRTLEYYEYMWSRHRTFDPHRRRFTEDLSPTLRMEILIQLNKECLLHCDFFREVSNECIMQLLHAFEFAVYLKDDLLAQEGIISSKLVFLTHGSAKVVQSGKLMPISLLHHGDYFGEKSLLRHHRNAVSVIALEHCDTRTLERTHFEKICDEYPELRDATLRSSQHMDVTEYNEHTRRRLSGSKGITDLVSNLASQKATHDQEEPEERKTDPDLASAIMKLTKRIDALAEQHAETDRKVQGILQKVAKLRPSSSLKKKISRSMTMNVKQKVGDAE